MLKHLLLNEVSFLPLRAAGDEGGAGGGAGGGAEPSASPEPQEGAEPPAPDDQGAGDGEAKPPAKAEGAEPPIELPNPLAPDWRDREIRRKHAQNQAAQRRLQELESENASLREIAEARRAAGGEQQPPAGGGGQPPAPAMDQDAVNRAAQSLRARERFEEDCAKVAENGPKTYKDKWNTAIQTLDTLGGFDAVSMAGILATDDPAKVMFELGSNPDLYQEIMDPSIPMERRIARFGSIGAAKAAPVRRPSGAPAPTDPITSHRAGEADESNLGDDVPDDKWYERRIAHKNKRFRAQAENGRIRT